MQNVGDIQEFAISNYDHEEPRLGERSFVGNTLTLTPGVPVTLDLKSLVNLSRVSQIKSIFLDWSGGTGQLQITTLATGTLKITGGVQTYLPIMISPDFVITFQGNGVLNFAMTNVDQHVGPWQTGVAGSGTIVAGTLGNNGDAVAPVASGLIGDDAYLYAFDIGTGTFNRVSMLLPTPVANEPVADASKSLLTTAMMAAVNTGSTQVEYLAAAQSTNDGVIPPTLLFTQAYNILFNGTSFDRQRGNVDSAALVTLAAQAPGTVNSADQTNYNGRGAKFAMNITALTGGASVQLQLFGKDPVSGVYYLIAQSAAITATGITIITVYPGIATVANVSLNDIIPRTFRVAAVVVAGTATGTISSSLIL